MSLLSLSLIIHIVAGFTPLSVFLDSFRHIKKRKSAKESRMGVCFRYLHHCWDSYLHWSVPDCSSIQLYSLEIGHFHFSYYSSPH